MKLQLCLLWSVLICPSIFGGELINARIDSALQSGIRQSIEQSFDLAIATFTRLQIEMPDNPAGYLFHAAALQLQMMDYETYEYDRKFQELIKQTLNLSESHLRKHPNDAWAYFFLGSAYGYQAFYQAKKGDFVESFKNGRRCVAALETALRHDSELYDVYLALGNYKYYRSKLSRHLAWLPFVADERREAIKMLKTTIDRGRYAKYSAMNSFCWIALDEKNYAEGWQMVNRALSEFPESRVFLWCAAKLAVKLEYWQNAAAHYQKILGSLNEEGRLSAHNELICRKNLFHIYLKLDKRNLAVQQCDRISEITAGPKNSKRSTALIKEMQKACGEYGRDFLIGQGEPTKKRVGR